MVTSSNEIVPRRIAGEIDEACSKVMKESDPKKRLELLLGVVSRTALECDHLHWQNEKRQAEMSELNSKLNDANEEIRRLRGKKIE